MISWTFGFGFIPAFDRVSVGVWRLSSLVIATLALAGCAGDVSPSDGSFFFARHGSPFGAPSSAVLEGVAVYDHGCLWIEAADGARYLALWPADAQLGMINREPAILGADGSLLVESGDAFIDVMKFGGSEASLETAEERVGVIPERCTAGGFWLVTEVVGRP